MLFRVCFVSSLIPINIFCSTLPTYHTNIHANLLRPIKTCIRPFCFTLPQNLHSSIQNTTFSVPAVCAVSMIIVSIKIGQQTFFDAHTCYHCCHTIINAMGPGLGMDSKPSTSTGTKYMYTAYTVVSSKLSANMHEQRPHIACYDICNMSYLT